MDDLSRPDEEFEQAYHELEITNRRLGGIRAIERFLPKKSDLLMLDVAAGGCDVSEALLGRSAARIVVLDINPRGFRFARKSWPVAGDALELPFRDGTFDVVTSTQVYEYVADMPRALAEACRVLRRGGRLLVLDTDWDSIVWASSDADRMRRVLGAWDEHLADPYLPRRLAGLMADAGLEVTDCRAVPLLNTSYSENSYSAGLIGFITAFTPGRGGVTTDEARAWADDLTSLGRDYFFSLNRYLFIGVLGP